MLLVIVNIEKEFLFVEKFIFLNIKVVILFNGLNVYVVYVVGQVITLSPNNHQVHLIYSYFPRLIFFNISITTLFRTGKIYSYGY